jgi:hypothetical protein
MRLISSRLEYLASVLPTTAMNDARLRARVHDLMQLEIRHGDVYVGQMVGVVELFNAYLRQQHEALLAHPGYADMKESGAKYILSKIEEALRFARRAGDAMPTPADLLDG